jgi:hypothetical protein
MGTQVIAGIIRYESKTGPWKILLKSTQQRRRSKTTTNDAPPVMQAL